MSIKITKKKEPRIVEYISPERQELNKRVAEIKDKWYKDVTEEDVEFLKANGLDYDIDRREVVFADTRKSVEMPYYSEWSWARGPKGKVDWLDKSQKEVERNRKGDALDFSDPTLPRLGRANHNFRTSDELERTAKELASVKRWGTDRQTKVWQGKHDREEARLANLRKDAVNKDWRQEQNAIMKRDYDRLKNINRHLVDDPDDDWSNSYDANIRRAKKDKAEREAELLQRYKDELDRYQKRIDDAEATKDRAIKKKNQILRRPVIEVEDDEVEEVKESCKGKKINSNKLKEWVGDLPDYEWIPVSELEEMDPDWEDDADYYICEWLSNHYGYLVSYLDWKMDVGENGKPAVNVLTLVWDKAADELDESCKRESIGSDLGEFQKWVDYDMDKYGEVSKNTMSKIRKAGLTLVKDDYGDWEVIAKKPIKRDKIDNPDDEA